MFRDPFEDDAPQMEARIARARLGATNSHIARRILIDRAKMDDVAAETNMSRSSVHRHMQNIIETLTRGG